jgi:methyl-accepting chemotaxis protein
MDQVTQQNAALVEEAAAAAESMQEQAQSLTQAVSVFKLTPRANAGGEAVVRTVKPVAKVAALPARKMAPANSGRAVALPKAVGAEREWSEF